MNGSPLILIPKPLPPGVRLDQGDIPKRPVCTRCRREETDGNPVILGKPRPAWVSGIAKMIREGVCVECRMILKGRR